MNFIKTAIEGPVIIEPKVFYDHRGYFFESFSLREFEANVQKINFVQDNESFSAERGVIRALHFQKGEAAQAKLIRVVQGRVLDVAVDIRPESPHTANMFRWNSAQKTNECSLSREDLHMDIWCWRTTPYFSISVIITMLRKWRVLTGGMIPCWPSIGASIRKR